MRNYNRTSKFLLLATLSFFLSLNFLLPTSASLTDTAKTTTTSITASSWSVQNLQATKESCDQVKLTCKVKFTWETPEMKGSYLTLFVYKDSKMEGPAIESTTGGSMKEMTLDNFQSGTYYFKVVYSGTPVPYHASISYGSPITITI